MRPTKIVPNGEPGVFERKLGSMEIVWRTALLGAILGFGSWLALGQIEMGKEIVETRGDVQSIHVEIGLRVEQRDKEHAQLVAADAATAERLDAVAASVQDVKDTLSTIESRQIANGNLLREIPSVKKSQKK